jgi:hypothetical protein
LDLETSKRSTVLYGGSIRNFAISRSGQYIAISRAQVPKKTVICLYSFPDMILRCSKCVSFKKVGFCWDIDDQLQVQMKQAWYKADLNNLGLTFDRCTTQQLRDKRDLAQGIQTHKYQVFQLKQYILNLETQEEIHFSSFSYCSSMDNLVFKYNDRWVFHKDYLFVWSRNILKILNLKFRTVQEIKYFETDYIKTIKCHPKYRILAIQCGGPVRYSTVQIFYF